MMSSADKITFPVYAAVDGDGRVMAAVDDLLLMLVSFAAAQAADGAERCDSNGEVDE